MSSELVTKRITSESLTGEERFHALVDAVTDYAIFLLDETGHVATWNAGAQRLKGYAPDEIIGRHFSLFYTAQDRAARRPEKILDTVRREGRYEEQGWRVRKDGTSFWADVVITAMRDTQGRIVAFAKVTRDLTERRAAAEDLRRSEERFRLLVEGVRDYAIYMLDPTGHVTTWNEGAERMKGYAPSEILGQHFSVFFPPADVESGKPARELELALLNERFEDDGWRRRKDGSLFWANVVLRPLRDAHGELFGFAKITRDLTSQMETQQIERKLLTERVARAASEENERRLRVSEEAARRAAVRAEDEARRAESATRVKDDFIATVSHELRTPLNAMMGYAALLRAKAGIVTDPTLAKALDAIHRNVQAQARIVDDILDVSRIATGKLRLDVKAMDLVTVCTDAIEVLRPSANAKKLTLRLVATADPALLVGDPERLRQVIWNLLSNAVKFTDAGGAITVTVSQESSKIVATVEDTGRGIESELLPHVFERFKQADSSTTRRFGGLGLGLAIVHHIVELHGGRAEAHSEGPGKGARFTIVLPVRAVVVESRDAVDDVKSVPAPAFPEVSLSGVRVLVVDDDLDARELLRVALEAANAEVETVDSAVAGLAAVRRCRPQVLVSDIGMPGEDGYSLMKRVRALDPAEGGRIPSIALTAYTRAEDRTKALAAGFTSHVGKPVNPTDLVAAVANLAALTRR